MDRSAPHRQSPSAAFESLGDVIAPPKGIEIMPGEAMPDLSCFCGVTATGHKKPNVGC